MLVTGYKKDEVKKYVISNNPGDFVFCEQKERLGTGHAVKQAAPYLPDAGKTLVLYADVPLVSVKALKNLLHRQTGKNFQFLLQMWLRRNGMAGLLEMKTKIQ